MSNTEQTLDQHPTRLFPLVRHLSRWLTPWLLRTPLTPNQITLTSVALSLAGAWLFVYGEYALGIGGALCLVGGYVLDNCDGEVARRKNLCSRYGALLDTAGDWLTHTAFFLALGIGTVHSDGRMLWLWLGVLAAAGTTVNSFITLRYEAASTSATETQTLERPGDQAGVLDWILFALRELSRADFCFIVLALALVDATWLLLPAAAIGAQVYWLTEFRNGANQYHV